jgi:hypothetical protein
VQANIRRAVEIIRAIDLGTEEVISMKVFRLKNADPVEMAELLTELYPKPTQGGNTQAQSPMVFGMGPGQGGPGGMAMMASAITGGQSQAGGSQRLQKGSTVTVAADQRTGSIIVSAPKVLMSQIATVVQKLDGDTARKQKVVILQLKNASPYQVRNNLQDLFQKNSSNTRTSTTQTDPLETRSTTQAQTQSAISSGSGSGAVGGGSGMGGNRGQ